MQKYLVYQMDLYLPIEFINIMKIYELIYYWDDIYDSTSINKSLSLTEHLNKIKHESKRNYINN